MEFAEEVDRTDARWLVVRQADADRKGAGFGPAGLLGSVEREFASGIADYIAGCEFIKEGRGGVGVALVDSKTIQRVSWHDRAECIAHAWRGRRGDASQWRVGADVAIAKGCGVRRRASQAAAVACLKQCSDKLAPASSGLMAFYETEQTAHVRGGKRRTGGAA